MLWGGTPRLLLLAARDWRIEIFTSTPMLAELADILGRSKFARKIAASQLSVDQLAQAMRSSRRWFGRRPRHASRPIRMTTSSSARRWRPGRR